MQTVSVSLGNSKGALFVRFHRFRVGFDSARFTETATVLIFASISRTATLWGFKKLRSPSSTDKPTLLRLNPATGVADTAHPLPLVFPAGVTFNPLTDSAPASPRTGSRNCGFSLCRNRGDQLGSCLAASVRNCRYQQ